VKNSLRLVAVVALATGSRALATGGDAAAPAAPPPALEVDARLEVPLFSERFAEFPVATAGDEVITLDQLSRALADAHSSRKEGQAGGKDFMPILERLLDVRLLVAEARAMGIDDLPEHEKGLASYDRDALRTALQAKVIAGTVPDALEVEKGYREATREWKIRSAFFPKQEDALSFKSAVLAGGDFSELAHRAVKEGKATFDEGKDFVRTAKLKGEVAAMIAGLSPGAISEPIKLQTGVTIVHVDDIRFVDDPAARGEVERQSIARQNREKLKKYYDGMVKRYTVTDKALLKSLDFEAPKPGLLGYQKDTRTLVRIQGAKSITVGEFAAKLAEQFYHGVERAARDKKINLQKPLILDAMISDRIVPVEARALGLHETVEYRSKRSDYESGQLFRLFLERVIIPEVRISEADLKAYYEQHPKDFTFPAFYRLETIGFAEVKDAQAALQKAQAGTDMKWLKQNAAGQVPDDKLAFTGGVVAGSAVSDDVRSVLSGVKPGDYRLFTHEGQAFVARVADVTPEATRPLDEVREDVQKAVFGEKLTAAVKAHANEIRKVRPVKVYLTHIG